MSPFAGAALALSGCLMLAACGSGSARVAEAPDRFAGMERRALHACAGPPTTVEQGPDGAVLVYQMSSSRRVSVQAPDAGPGRASSNIPAPPSTVYRRACSARFLVQDGRVALAEFQGVGAGGQDSPEACEAFVRRCLRER